ncbi:GrlR family regulatory protein [Altererythrobacter sp. ZODW24]|uniref:GrlR family regulatory protein n=1 Tax=Altererythrobacter sp. ZODW24 TaxID=2185142 RepID=UPI000DF80645|nr:GrlR family regulatory protein [Altererythrobacter sp. ZODW24]
MALKDGLYKVEFQTQLGAGAGIAVLRNGIIEGGDSMMFYRGTYSQTDSQFQAEVSNGTHSNDPSMESVLGIASGTIKLDGKTETSPALMNGTSPQAPGVNFQARLSMID